MTQFFFDNLTTSIEFVRAGKLRALGITSAERNPLTPELVPICETMPELKPFDVSTWFGVFLPAGTPKPIVDSLNAQMKVWLDDAKTKERFTTMAGFPAYGTPAEFDKFVNAQIALWKGVIDKEGPEARRERGPAAFEERPRPCQCGGAARPPHRPPRDRL